MTELKESKIKSEQIKPFLTSLGFDLLAFYKICEDKVEKIIAKAVKEGLTPDQLINELGKLFEDTPKSVVKSKVVLQHLGTADSESIYLVDGLTIRNDIDTNYTEGGHDLVYGYIPALSVWIDNDVRESEREYIVIHEVSERMLMEGGFDYDTAHDKATVIEQAARNNPTMKNAIIKRLGIKLGNKKGEK